MLDRYREILSLPGTLRFSLVGLLARTPMSMVGISLILAIRALYDSYSLAGVISAIEVISFAIGAPILARLVDRYGQAQVMIPSVTISTLALVAVAVGAMNVVSPLLLGAFAVVYGATAGSFGALIRSRWANSVENPQQLQAAYALEAAFDEVAFMVSPIVATMLSAAIHPAAGLWAAIGLQTVGTYGFLFQRSTQPPLGAPTPKGVKKESIMRNGGMIVIATTFIATGALFGSLNLSVVAFADALNQSQFAGIVLATMSVGALASALFYGARNWRSPLWKLFIIGVVALAVGVSPLLFAPNLIILGIFMMIAGLALSPVMTNVNTMVQRIAPPSRLTESLTWMATATTVGMSVGSAFTGPFVDSQGHKGGFLAVLIFGWAMVVAAVLGLKTLRRALEEADARRPHITEDGHVDYPEETLEEAEVRDEETDPGND